MAITSNQLAGFAVAAALGFGALASAADLAKTPMPLAPAEKTEAPSLLNLIWQKCTIVHTRNANGKADFVTSTCDNNGHTTTSVAPTQHSHMPLPKRPHHCGCQDKQNKNWSASGQATGRWGNSTSNNGMKHGPKG